MKIRTTLFLCAALATAGAALMLDRDAHESSPSATPATAARDVSRRSDTASSPATPRLAASDSAGTVETILRAALAADSDEERAELLKTSHFELVAALRRDPAAVLPVLEKFLGDADPATPAARLAVGAMIAVGTPQVQAALVGVLGERAHDVAFTQLVVPSLGFVRRPSVATEQAVRTVARDGGDEQTRTMAELALGTMASNLATREPARATALVDEYATRLAHAGTAEERARDLAVLGNAATPAAGTAIATQLGDHDPAVRSQALAALREVPTPEVEHTLASALTDPDSQVRASAAWALSYRAPSLDTVRAMILRLGTETDDSVAAALLDAIWMRRVAAQDLVLATVRDVAAHHASQAIRERALALLAG